MIFFRVAPMWPQKITCSFNYRTGLKFAVPKVTPALLQEKRLAAKPLQAFVFL